MTEEKNGTEAAKTEAPVVENPAGATTEAAAEKSEAKPARRGGGAGGRGRGRGRGQRRKREPKEFEESILKIDRVTRVTRGGRQMRFRVTVVIGDKKGRVGFGIGKSEEIIGSIQKAVSKAKRNLITVKTFNDTIPHEVKHKFKASLVHLMPAQQGKGVIAGGAVRKILDLAGVKNVLSKIHGSRNKITCAYCTFAALKMLSIQAPHGTEQTTEMEAEVTEVANAKAEKKEIKDNKTEKAEKSVKKTKAKTAEKSKKEATESEKTADNPKKTEA